MAGTGPLPSATHQRERVTRRHQAATTTLVDDGAIRGPELAEATGRDDWHADTLRWFAAWRSSPQAQMFAATDWERLLLIAPLRESIARSHSRPSSAAVSELRLNEERLGATYADRRRLRIQIDAPRPLAPGALITRRGADLRARMAWPHTPVSTDLETNEPPSF